jgi:hypothetical protein
VSGGGATGGSGPLWRDAYGWGGSGISNKMLEDPNAPASAPAYKNYVDSYGTGWDMLRNSGGLENIMSYPDYKRLFNSFGLSNNNNNGGGTTPPPVTPPTPSDALQGLMAQAADPYGTYGQLGVANPYLQNIQNRFGYDPSGLAYGVNLQQSPSWYLPGIAHPNVVYPAIKGGATGK